MQITNDYNMHLYLFGPTTIFVVMVNVPSPTLLLLCSFVVLPGTCTFFLFAKIRAQPQFNYSPDEFHFDAVA